MPICFSIFFFLEFLLIEDYGKCALRKEPVICCSFIKHVFRKSYWQTLGAESINTQSTLKQLLWESATDKFFQYLDQSF